MEFEAFWEKHPRHPSKTRKKKKTPSLITPLPHVGYFLAGGIAGAVSRTVTAPLDRLKVYLIAQTTPGGAKITAPVRGASALIQAIKELWRAGGVRSLFAGMLVYEYSFIPPSLGYEGHFLTDLGMMARKWFKCRQGDAGISYQIRCI